MLSNALHTMIAAIFARIFARLEQLLQLWQSGPLPTRLIPNQTRITTSHRHHPATTRPRHPRRMRAARLITPGIRRAAPAPTTPRPIPTHTWPPAPKPRPLRRSPDTRCRSSTKTIACRDA